MPENLNNFELKLPADVLQHVPANQEQMIHYFSKYFDGVIEEYDARFQYRVKGAFAGPLSKYEKAILKDFLIDAVLGKLEPLRD